MEDDLLASEYVINLLKYLISSNTIYIKTSNLKEKYTH